jgi:arylsulfatase
VTGKDDTDTPGQHGFTEWATLPTDENEARPHPEEFVRNGQRVPVTGNADGRQGQYVTDLIVQEALSFLQQRQPGQPFFLLVVCPLPVSSDAIPSLRAYAGRDWPQSRKLYAARVTEFDRVVGVIRDEIANLRLANRTALLVTSDGSPRVEVPGDLEFFHSTGGLRGSRGTLYEGGLRVPFIARWPGQAFSAVERDDAAVCWDLLPTLAESSGAVDVPRPLDGVSITPLLKGGIGRVRDMLYWELRQNGDLGQAVRMGDWKVIRPVGKTRREDCELYDLRKDPAEKKNVAPQHPDIVTKFLR